MLISRIELYYHLYPIFGCIKPSYKMINLEKLTIILSFEFRVKKYVLQNLLSNAIKFHGQNPPEINISAQKEEKEWKLAVKDNGIGIKPEYQKQIFKVFKRLHIKENYPGTGIGLSITQKNHFTPWWKK